MKTILFVQTNYPIFLEMFHEKIAGSSLSYSGMKKVWDREMFGHANFYSKNLKQLGWKAQEVIANDLMMQGQWARENKIHFDTRERWWTKKIPESIKNYLGVRGWVKKILFEQVKKIRPDVIYIHDLSLLNKLDIRRLKKLVKLVVGQIACPLPIDQGPLYEYDLIISSFPHYVRKFRKMGIGGEYLRWCFEPDVNKKIGRAKKKYDVAFVGGYSSAHSQGNSTLENLARKVRVDFWGIGEQSLPPTSPIRQTFHGFVWGEDMYKIFSQAKIVVNRHINVAGNVANNMRMFDVTGVGSLLVTDSRPNMKEFFKVSEEVITYSSDLDLVKKVRFFLSHPREREKIALAGKRCTLREHTYGKRMKELDGILRSYLNRAG